MGVGVRVPVVGGGRVGVVVGTSVVALKLQNKHKARVSSSRGTKGFSLKLPQRTFLSRAAQRMSWA